MVARGLGGEEANNGECRVSFWGEKKCLGTYCNDGCTVL